jgi:hypothetical protein
MFHSEVKHISLSFNQLPSALARRHLLPLPSRHQFWKVNIMVLRGPSCGIMVLLQALSRPQRISDCIIYLYTTVIVTEILSYCVRFEIFIAVIICVVCKYWNVSIYLPHYTQSSHIRPHHSYHLCYSSSFFKATYCFFFQACVLRARSWRWGKRCYWHYFILTLSLLVTGLGDTKTTNDDVMAAEDMCQVWGKVACFVMLQSKLFKTQNTHTTKCEPFCLSQNSLGCTDMVGTCTAMLMCVEFQKRMQNN